VEGHGHELKEEAIRGTGGRCDVESDEAPWTAAIPPSDLLICSRPDDSARTLEIVLLPWGGDQGRASPPLQTMPRINTPWVLSGDEDCFSMVTTHSSLATDIGSMRDQESKTGLDPQPRLNADSPRRAVRVALWMRS